MDDNAPPESSAGLEDALRAWDDRLARLERETAAVLQALKRLRRVAQEGAVASFPGAAANLQTCLETMQATARGAGAPPAVDLAKAFADGSFVAELDRAAAALKLTLVQRDGRISIYPVVLRLEAHNQGVRIGRRLERRVRPSFLARQLRALQRHPGRFNPRSFVDRLFRGYAVLASARDPKWLPGRRGEGPLVPLVDLHHVLTILPVAAADLPLEEFLVGLVQLNRQPDTRTGRGHRFAFVGATGTKGPKRLTAFDETGASHDFYAVRFTLE